MVGLAIGLAVVVALLPEPIEADSSVVVRGPLSVYVSEEGETRCRDRYTITAPINGRLARPVLDEGQPVARGAVVARIYPAPIDTRQMAEAAARVDAALAEVEAARALRRQAMAESQQATSSRQRAEALVDHGLISREQFEQASTAEATAREGLANASSRVDRAIATVVEARAALEAARSEDSGQAVVVRAPVSGVVLRVFEESERVLAAGAPLLEIGNTSAVELVVDVLTSDAVGIRPGAAVELGDWGGTPVVGTVTSVEPAAFTRVSALGVEEQRVNVIVGIDDVPPGLGVAYRAEARILVWSGDDVLKVPTPALFRSGSGWAVFVIDDGRALSHAVEVGHVGSGEAEILGGIAEGQRILVHPPNDLVHGAKVTDAR